MRISDWSSDVCSSDLFKHFNRLGWRQIAPLGRFKNRLENVQIFVGVLFRNPHDDVVLARKMPINLADTDLRSSRQFGHGRRMNRSEEGRVGTEWVRTCRSRWEPYQ